MQCLHPAMATGRGRHCCGQSGPVRAPPSGREELDSKEWPATKSNRVPPSAARYGVHTAQPWFAASYQQLRCGQPRSSRTAPAFLLPQKLSWTLQAQLPELSQTPAERQVWKGYSEIDLGRQLHLTGLRK